MLKERTKGNDIMEELTESTKSYLAGLFDCNSLVRIEHETKGTLVLTIFTSKKNEDMLNTIVEIKKYSTKIEQFKYTSCRNRSKDKVCNLCNDKALDFLVDIFNYIKTKRSKKLIQIVISLMDLYKINTTKLDLVNMNNSTHHSLLKNIHSNEIDLLIKELKDLQ